MITKPPSYALIVVFCFQHIPVLFLLQFQMFLSDFLSLFQMLMSFFFHSSTCFCFFSFLVPIFVFLFARKVPLSFLFIRLVPGRFLGLAHSVFFVFFVFLLFFGLKPFFII